MSEEIEVRLPPSRCDVTTIYKAFELTPVAVIIEAPVEIAVTGGSLNMPAGARLIGPRPVGEGG